VDREESKKLWKDYMPHLLNEENVSDQKGDSRMKEGMEGPEYITRDEVVNV
jgi:hypothetical protein